MVYLILIAYLALTFLSSLPGASKGNQSPEGYFLADRGLGTVTLFFTLIATNFSAFFFLGFAGQGYKIGYSYYAMMGFGTAFAALGFYLVGNKAWRLGRQRGYITPVELVADIGGSPLLKWVYLAVMVLFTFPYLALQPIGAGYLLENLTGGEIPYFAGASLLTIFIIFYVFVGGMKSVASTDVKQGIMMVLLMLAAVVVIAYQLGGIGEANRQVHALKPELFSRAGGGDYFTPQKWLSLCLLWIACVPMFPQLFMRFFIAKDLKTFKTSTVLYAAIPCVLFLLPVTVGVLGHLTYPELTGKEIDQILPKMLMAHSPEWFYTLVMTGALAAFMSTLDSQLLALGTIATRDVYLPLTGKKDDSPEGLKRQVWIGKLFVVLFALVGLALAYQPFDTIFDIAKMAFSGLAVLFPTTLALFYMKNVNATACALSIIAGELVVVGMYAGWIPSAWVLGFDSVLPALLLSGGIILLGGAVNRGGDSQER